MMIVEGLVTTRTPDGLPHLAPMGPILTSDNHRLVLRPFPTSQTFGNLKRHPEGVFHITDDVLLLARAAIGRVTVFPPVQEAVQIQGFVLQDTCRALEFRVVAIDDSEPRVRLECDVRHVHRFREFLGFNRAKHMVVEAAILATRVHLLSLGEILAEYDKWDLIVTKTGGPAEMQAMRELREYVIETSA